MVLYRTYQCTRAHISPYQLLPNRHISAINRQQVYILKHSNFTYLLLRCTQILELSSNWLHCVWCFFTCKCTGAWSFYDVELENISGFLDLSIILKQRVCWIAPRNLSLWVELGHSVTKSIACCIGFLYLFRSMLQNPVAVCLLIFQFVSVGFLRELLASC